jgi:hypothetical protein
MTSIDPLHRSSGVRRSRKAAQESLDGADSAADAGSANLPVAVSPPRTIPPRPARIGGDAAIHAQVIGERRGLRAGPTIHDEAKASYTKTEWSGSWDRRAPKGRKTKTEI